MVVIQLLAILFCPPDIIYVNTRKGGKEESQKITISNKDLKRVTLFEQIKKSILIISPTTAIIAIPHQNSKPLNTYPLKI